MLRVGEVHVVPHVGKADQHQLFEQCRVSGSVRNARVIDEGEGPMKEDVGRLYDLSHAAEKLAHKGSLDFRWV